MAVSIPEEPGLLVKLLNAATVGQGLDVTECKYRCVLASSGGVSCGWGGGVCCCIIS